MYTKEQLNDLFEHIVKDIDISEELFDTAEREYKNLGKWLDQETPKYKLSIYPQGSFALGTVIKPIKGTDDYDLDLVCEMEEQYGLTAKELKVDIIKPLLIRYRRTSKDIEEKRRCWHVEYEHIPQFHMDIIPAVHRNCYIDITDKDEELSIYQYLGSNPSGYIEWFQSRMAVRSSILREQYFDKHRLEFQAQADIEKIKAYHYKTPLQKTIQILKRHRDIMFDGSEDHTKPISIIITTIAAQLYNNEDNIADTLSTILNQAEGYIKDNMRNGEYHIDNPCFTGGDKENFADKWNEHPERAKAFFAWLNQAKDDFSNRHLMVQARTDIAKIIKKCLGEVTSTRVFNKLAEEERQKIANGTLKVNPTMGTISSNGSVDIPKNHHYGK